MTRRQDDVVRTLKNASRVTASPAYLLVGPRGTGKTSIADLREGAQLQRGPKRFRPGDPICRPSQRILPRRHRIDGVSNNGIDQVRELRDRCAMRRRRPFQGLHHRRGAHLSSQAFKRC